MSRLHDALGVSDLDWRDLRSTSTLQVICGLILTPPWFILSLTLAQWGHFASALTVSAVFFMAGLRQAHEAFHGNLGIPRRATNVLLFVLSLLMVVPLHAVKYSHLQHHNCPLSPDDVEGEWARLPGWLAVVLGPLFTIRLFLHAFRGAHGRDSKWLAAEVGSLITVAGAALVIGSVPLIYHITAMLIGNCLTGFFAVWLVHHDCDPRAVVARSQRGWLINALTFNLLYHREHHLFPGVPACNLPELARRIDTATPNIKVVQVVRMVPDKSAT